MNALLGPITLPLEIPDQSPCLTIADAERALASWTDLAPGPRAEDAHGALDRRQSLGARPAPDIGRCCRAAKLR
jgi:hypothetical protein